MKCIIILLAILVNMSAAVPAERADYSIGDSIGQLPELTVTAERFEYEDEVWSGLLDTIVVTAPRVKVFTGRTADKNAAGPSLPLAGFIILGTISLSSFSWFMYRRYLYRKHRMQACHC
jgi:hypothetical protein